jgi:hypothetical protein
VSALQPAFDAALESADENARVSHRPTIATTNSTAFVATIETAHQPSNGTAVSPTLRTTIASASQQTDQSAFSPAVIAAHTATVVAANKPDGSAVTAAK